MSRCTKKLKITLKVIDQASEEWRTLEVKKLAGLQGKEKWNTINKLLNHSATNQMVQPLRAIVERKSEYIFNGDGIRTILQEQHIRTTAKEAKGELSNIKEVLDDMTANAQDGGTPIMSDDITSIEVKNTFGTCSGAPGQDGVQKVMIDKADRESMQECLHYIFKSEWQNGKFLDS